MRGVPKTSISGIKNRVRRRVQKAAASGARAIHAQGKTPCESNADDKHGSAVKLSPAGLEPTTYG
jgi:hypothetical protein